MFRQIKSSSNEMSENNTIRMNMYHVQAEPKNENLISSDDDN